MVLGLLWKILVENVCASTSLCKCFPIPHSSSNCFFSPCPSISPFQPEGNSSILYCWTNPLSCCCSNSRKRRISIQEFLELGIKITQALAELHDEKVAHLDLKPSNIIYNRETKELKLSDLNIAQKIPVSASGNFRGTPAYVSPEQTGRMGNSLLDHRSDLYSLGVTFYELLTGKPHLFFVSVYPSIYLPSSNRFLFLIFLCFPLNVLQEDIRSTMRINCKWYKLM